MKSYTVERQSTRLVVAVSTFFSLLMNERLVLGLGFSEHYSIHTEHAPKILCTLHKPNATIQRVMLLEDEQDERRELPRANNERLLIRLNRKRPAKNIATRIINSVHAIFAHFQRVAVGMEDFGVYRIPPRGMIRNRAILTKELISLEKAVRQFGYRDEMFIARLGSYTVVPESVMAHLFFFLPFALASRALFDACHFFEACSSQYNFVGDVVTEILHDPEWSPETEQERLCLENVVLSGYRTVEALVGEPGREPRSKLASLLSVSGPSLCREVLCPVIKARLDFVLSREVPGLLFFTIYFLSQPCDHFFTNDRVSFLQKKHP